PISTFIRDNENYLKQTVGLGVTYDVGIRKFQILNKEIGVLLVNGLCDTNYIINILEEALDTNEIRDVDEDTVKLLEIRL
ncbi:spore germination protein, partial [Bacillus cereus]|nr:spore germination protein [Bacillus cereus]